MLRQVFAQRQLPRIQKNAFREQPENRLQGLRRGFFRRRLLKDPKNHGAAQPIAPPKRNIDKLPGAQPAKRRRQGIKKGAIRRKGKV